MANIIYARFTDQVFQDSLPVQEWTDIPARLRTYAILWRDGDDIRRHFKSISGYYKVAAKLRDYGIDITMPCNVVALSRRVQTVFVTPISALRSAA